MSNKHADFLAKLRDGSQMIADAANELLKSMAPPELGLTNEPVSVNEIAFNILRWDPQKGAQLGDFEVAYKASNLDDKWLQAYNILRNSNAVIKNRHTGAGYAHSYWVYGKDKIYRQKIKPRTSN